MLYPNVEVGSEHDFRRLKGVAEALTRDPVGGTEFDYIPGLLDVIHESVRLEFDKGRVASVQDSVQSIYRGKKNGWTVRTVAVHGVEGATLFMEKAPGTSAVKVADTDPVAYKEAMSVLSELEIDVLFGADPRPKGARPLLIANPDFHDGQVLIDVENTTITLLDFGQAVPITTEDRAAAIDLLEIIGSGFADVKAVERLNKRFLASPESKPLTEAELGSILAGKEPMARFIHLIGQIQKRLGRVPIPSIHWIFGANRQIELGKRLDLEHERTFRDLVILSRVARTARFPAALREWSRRLPRPLGRPLRSLASMAAEALYRCLGERLGEKLPDTIPAGGALGH